jgi:FG-GAP repeat
MRIHFALSIMLACLIAIAAVSVTRAQDIADPGEFRSTVATLPREAQAAIVPQLAKLTASDGVAGDYFGAVVAMSGGTVVVGAASGRNGQQGAAYVFVKPASGWADMTQTAKLTASDGGPNDYFGSAVTISGNTIVVAKGIGGTIPAYVFIEPPAGWIDMTETAKLSTPTNYFGGGAPPALATNGNTVFLGVPWAVYNREQFEGVVYVFVEPPGGWVNINQTARLVATDAGNDSGFGSSISLSGNTVAVARGWYGGPIDIFVKPKSGWKSTINQIASLTSSDGAGFYCVSGSSSTLVAGAQFATAGSVQLAGAAYVFIEPPTGWTSTTETAKLIASDGAASDELGASVAVSNGGSLVIAGAPYRSSNTGAAYVFAKPASGWVNMSQMAILTAFDGAQGDWFGESTSAIGNVIVTGAPQYDISEPGAVYVFGKK